MSPPDPTPITPLPTTQQDPPGGRGRATLAAVVAGLVLGGVIVYLGIEEDRFAGLAEAEIAIRINDLGPRVGRDVFVPTHGWTMQVELPDGLPPSVRERLEIAIREERTGARVEITDRFAFEGLIGTFVVPKELGLIEGVFSVSATLYDDDERRLQTFRRQRIRTWLGGPPIGSRQRIHFDFTVDRNEDGRPDLETDLVELGLAAGGTHDATTRLAGAIADRALARLHRAYDRTDDPNHTGGARDQVYVRFHKEPSDEPRVTRICVGGRNERHPDSIGFVRFDPHNSIKGSDECQGTADDGSDAGIFPAALSVYADDPLFEKVRAPFLAEAGGTPFGAHAEDASLPGAGGETERGRAVALVIEVIGDALGTVMAHEAAHGLGLVPPGKPGLGLFAGDEGSGDGYAHNQDLEGGVPATPWLMNPGSGFSFADLAGRGDAGELRFRPLNWAYLKDRLILKKR